MATKPTKQQLAQSKARAGGNNPIKVTSSGLKKLGTAAAIAASLTPVGRGAKIAGIIAKPLSKVVQAKSVKNTKVVVEKIAKMQEKTRAEKIASNSVKVKPAAKRMGNPPDTAKTQFKNNSSRQRASDRAYRDETFLEAQELDNLSFSSSNASNAAKYVGKNAKLQRKPNLPKPKEKYSKRVQTKLARQEQNWIDGYQSGSGAGHY